jgi:hypothetical protein
MKSINKNLWDKYIKTYESFNKEIPEELKDLFKKIRIIIGNPTDSFNIDIDLNSLDFCDLIVELEVEFEKLNSSISYQDKDIVYYSNLNIYDLISGKTKTKIPIIIKDIQLNVDKLCSVMSHEIRHIYDVYTINEDSDMNSFTKSLYYTLLKEKEDDKYFSNFLEMVYLSLEHELIARNTMIWEMLSYCKCSKQELYSLYHQSYIYKSFDILKSFDYTDIINTPNIIQKSNIFINYFGGTLCDNDDDVILFFKNWKKYFSYKSDEYIKAGYDVLNDILSINEFKNNKIEVKNVKDLLLDIHNNFIFKNK